MRRRRTTLRLIVMLIVGVIATIITASFGEWAYAPTVGWCFAATL
jgi:hypothetical protein